MRPSEEILGPRALVSGWLAAAIALATVLLLAVVGQGIGAIAGDCQWIGLTVPPQRQVWALVNEPTPHFASQPRAAGYWLGSLALPLMVAGLTVGFCPRPRSVAAELSVIQIAWTAAAVGCVWLPLLEMSEGHLGRWLHFRQWPDELIWVAPILGFVCAPLSVLRLLAVARCARGQMSRLYRVAVVVVHLALPTAGWAAASAAIRGGIPGEAAAALTALIGTAVVVAWIGYPPAIVHHLEVITGGSLVRRAAIAVVVIAVVWFGGRPLADGRSAGILWTEPGAFDNVREWIAPVPVPNR